MELKKVTVMEKEMGKNIYKYEVWEHREDGVSIMVSTAEVYKEAYAMVQKVSGCKKPLGDMSNHQLFFVPFKGRSVYELKQITRFRTLDEVVIELEALKIHASRSCRPTEEKAAEIAVLQAELEMMQAHLVALIGGVETSSLVWKKQKQYREELRVREEELRCHLEKQSK
ncbi:MAG: hypothetical protein LBB27_03045 [Tannerellaceae bacterium]|jgi:hypothetical protein|nr:hypothetical protein [Tannerellaceae bacterium]